jgi:hypothetical protein
MRTRSMPSSASEKSERTAQKRPSVIGKAQRFGVGLVAALGVILATGVPAANAASSQLITPQLFVDISCNKTANTYSYKTWGVDFPKRNSVDADWVVGEEHSNGDSWAFGGGTSLTTSSTGSWTSPTYGPVSTGSGSGTATIRVTATYGLGSISGSDSCTW